MTLQRHKEILFRASEWKGKFFQCFESASLADLGEVQVVKGFSLVEAFCS